MTAAEADLALAVLGKGVGKVAAWLVGRSPIEAAGWPVCWPKSRAHGEGYPQPPAAVQAA